MEKKSVKEKIELLYFSEILSILSDRKIYLWKIKHKLRINIRLQKFIIILILFV